MTLALTEIRDLACRYVPAAAADRRLYTHDDQWWPAHEIGHFLIATPAECHQPQFGIDTYDPAMTQESPLYRYVVVRELAAISISQRLLRRSGHKAIADEEIQYTDEDTLECSFDRQFKRSVEKLLHANKVTRLPTSQQRLEVLLARKAREVGTTVYPSRRAAEDARQ